MKTIIPSLLEKVGISRYQCQLADIILFKISWVLLVVLQDAGLVYTVPILFARLLLSASLGPALLAVAITTALGLLMDSLLTSFGVFIFNVPWLPAWLVVLWLSFALVLHNGFGFVSTWPPGYQALAGAGFGIGGYTAGYLMDAVIFTWSYLATMGILAIGWALYLPLAIFVVQRIEKWRRA